jgi:hypothetical protein
MKVKKVIIINNQKPQSTWVDVILIIAACVTIAVGISNLF